MHVYADVDDYPLNEDQYNLFTLRVDLRLNFDQGAFVFIPKSGQLRIHFLKRVCQSGILYHDTFNDHNRLARGFMLARFGWAVIRLAKEYVRTPRDFNFSTEDGDGDEDEEDENDGSGSGEPTKEAENNSYDTTPEVLTQEEGKPYPTGTRRNTRYAAGCIHRI